MNKISDNRNRGKGLELLYIMFEANAI